MQTKLSTEPLVYEQPRREERIARNAAKCNVCKDEISSAYRNDHTYCSCGELCVSGGRVYLRRVFGPGGFTEMSEYED